MPIPIPIPWGHSNNYYGSGAGYGGQSLMGNIIASVVELIILIIIIVVIIKLIKKYRRR
ncbi:hypothetical protein N4T77_03745 [Clostridium sp. CX1]|uniref:Sporulation protein YjcZ n=1 Tax=Clostridium tanneri TaxID=3037988 RepID=A0ABU4JWY0_9CLOT|nr:MULTISPECIES: hypothetical protein [unclassified Clostridium]MCT8975707.1 hypothetical protein [Clostridium sp. CX1]MDW8802424.1 hypothetical protein [Clostridium sp. A1-XYC3]